MSLKASIMVSNLMTYLVNDPKTSLFFSQLTHTRAKYLTLQFSPFTKEGI